MAQQIWQNCLMGIRFLGGFVLHPLFPGFWQLLPQNSYIFEDEDIRDVIVCAMQNTIRPGADAAFSTTSFTSLSLEGMIVGMLRESSIGSFFIHQC